ncbi:MAG: hypothetical protein M1822_010243 [Bathelium mastoideum]|nr:MAG: hypothetical protein M1822_010243 [Bathelium mastoideum]
MATISPRSDQGTTQSPAKTKRLSRACNLCRNRKVRCDEQQPSCKNCELANVPCVTTHPKDAGRAAARKRARDRSITASANASSASVTSAGLVSALQNEQGRPQSWTTTVAEEQEDGRIGQMEQRIRELESLVVTMSDQQSTPGLTSHSAANVQQLEPSVDVSRDRRARPNTPTSLVGDFNSNVQPVTYSVMATSPAAFNTDFQTSQTKYLGPSSLQVFTQWLELSTGSLNISLSAHFQFGMRHCEENIIPLIPEFLSLPQDTQPCVEAYFANIHPLFPFLRREIVLRWVDNLARYESPSHCQPTERPALACVYAVLSMGKRILYGANSEEDLKNMDAAYALLPSLLGQPFLPSAQALMLISIALRSRNKEGAAAQTLGQAIRILQSIGLHTRRTPSDEARSVPSESSAGIGLCTWWSAYCMEKLFAFESGRPSIIHDEDVDVATPVCPVGKHDAFGASIKLAKIHSNASEHIFSPRLWDKAQSPHGILRTVGELDADLVSWSNALPDVLRPGRDQHYCPPEILPARTYLSLLYHQTVATIHRAALLMDSKVHRVNVSRFCANTPYLQRLLASETICVGAARSTIEAFLECLQERGRPILLTMTAPLEAVYVLVIYTMRNSSAWTAKSDLALLEGACDAIEHVYESDGQTYQFCRMLQSLKQLAMHYVHHAATARMNKQKSTLLPRYSPTNTNAMDHNTLANDQSMTVGYSQSQNQEHNIGFNTGGSLEAPSAFEWDAIWPRLYLGNLPSGLDELGFSQQLLGLPDMSDEPFDFDFT